MTLDLGIDVGSQFVDVAMRAAHGWQAGKIAREAGDAVAPMLDDLEQLLAGWGVRLGTIDSVRIASTIGINSILARHGARVALVTSEGFGDTLRLGRQNRARLYDPVARSPSPHFLVDSADVFEIGGRIDAEGREVDPLDEARLLASLAEIRERGIGSVAVCLLFAFVNPAHERRCRALAGEAGLALDVCLSHEIDPRAREFERTVSICLEAWLRPRVRSFHRALQAGLEARGFRGRFLLARSDASLCEPARAERSVSHLLTSGPAAAAQCAATVARSVAEPLALGLDVGSASSDFFLLRGGAPQIVDQGSFDGIALRQRMIDAASLGLGGASGVRRGVDGELSFTSDPASGEGATLTDALIELGRIAIAPRADAAATLRAIDAVGSSSSPAHIARAVLESAALRIAAALLRFAVRRNVDPAECVLIAMGGLGGSLAADIATALGIRRVCLPEAPSVAGALGLLLAEPRFEVREPLGAWSDALAPAPLAEGLRVLVDRARALLAQSGWAGDSSVEFVAELAVDRQMQPHTVPFASADQGGAGLVAAFAGHYRQLYGVEPPARVYVVAVKAACSGLGPAEPPQFAWRAPDRAASPIDSDALVETTAGSIWKPAGWRLQRAAGAITLTAPGAA